MTPQDIKTKMEELDMDTSMIEDVMVHINKKDNVNDIVDRTGKPQEFELRSRLDNETDWKKRAQLAARIISLNLS